MEISELKAELEKLHQASFGWALNCCRHNRSDAEEGIADGLFENPSGEGHLSR
jgi:hypothetical protein